jgi:hypothetical protein
MLKDLEKTKQSLIDLLEQGINPFGKPDPDCDKCELVDGDEYGLRFIIVHARRVNNE